MFAQAPTNPGGVEAGAAADKDDAPEVGKPGIGQGQFGQGNAPGVKIHPVAQGGHDGLRLLHNLFKHIVAIAGAVHQYVG